MIESRLGLAAPGVGGARVAAIQRKLQQQEALISFHTGARQSFVWAMTRDEFEAHVLPGLNEIAPLARKYRDAIEQDSALDGANGNLYSKLFGGLSARIHDSRDWLLSLDNGLYDIPYAALGPDGSPLILSHSIRAIPGANLLTRTVSAPKGSSFVGAGDAIYNMADPRWKGPRIAKANSFARLVNTGDEVLAVSRAWAADREPTLLLGEAFNRAALERAFRAEPAILHIAAHVVRSEADASNVLIGIGLAETGAPDFLTPADIASKPVRVGLVSINGCASGSGMALPGSGLIGLTRAWLIAGVTAVAATYWPINDDRGELFSNVYREIGRSGNSVITSAKVARALQTAQIEAFRSKSPRSRPSYWAAVFISGKS